MQFLGDTETGRQGGHWGTDAVWVFLTYGHGFSMIFMVIVDDFVVILRDFHGDC